MSRSPSFSVASEERSILLDDLTKLGDTAAELESSLDRVKNSLLASPSAIDLEEKAIYFSEKIKKYRKRFGNRFSHTPIPKLLKELSQYSKNIRVHADVISKKKVGSTNREESIKRAVYKIDEELAKVSTHLRSLDDAVYSLPFRENSASFSLPNKEESETGETKLDATNRLWQTGKKVSVAFAFLIVIGIFVLIFSSHWKNDSSEINQIDEYGCLYALHQTSVVSRGSTQEIKTSFEEFSAIANEQKKSVKKNENDVEMRAIRETCSQVCSIWARNKNENERRKLFERLISCLEKSENKAAELKQSD